jgi:hypothetical protein
MELLRQHGLYGGGLTDVDNPLLVKRYNECLAGIGQEPTKLNRFQIDGRGWSPEVAAEKQNPAYLSHGGALQYAILLTPDQKGKPIYKSYFSFERAILAYLFNQAQDAIARITKTAGIWIQMDPGLSEIERLNDLAMIKSITVTLGDTEHLVQAADDQQKLVGQFLGRSDAWTDEALRRQLVASGQKFGDLRFAPSFKTSYQYGETDCFYTPLFNGTFIFRESDSGKKGVIVVGDESLAEQGGIGCWVGPLQDRHLFSKLLARGLIEVPIKWYENNLKVIEDLCEVLLVSTIYGDDGSNIDFLQLNPAQRERCVMKYRDKLPNEFSLLERLKQRLGHGDVVDEKRLTPQLKWMLARPVEGLPTYIAEMIWKLICRVAPVRVTTQFTYDKEAFFAAYGTWPEARKRWSVETILSSGLVPRRHS